MQQKANSFVRWRCRSVYLEIVSEGEYRHGKHAGIRDPIFEVRMRMIARNVRGICSSALLLVGGACASATEPDATLDAVLARGAASVSGPIDVRDTGSIAGTFRILLPRAEAPRYTCGLQLVVGPTTKIFRRNGGRATSADLQVGVTISAWVDDGFTFPFCRPTGGANAIVIEQ